MISVTATGTILTFTGGLGSVSFKDASDVETPISFGTIEPFGVEFDLNHELVVGHRQVTPEFSLAFIPGSKSDRTLRAFLLSSLIGDVNGSIGSPSDVMIPSATLTVQDGVDGNGKSKTRTFTFKEGYLVGGSACLGANTEGRLTTTPWRFVFKTVASDGSGGGGSASFCPTQLLKDGDEIENLYYARVSAGAKARMISHPIETGAVVFDHKFVEPGTVEVRVKVPLAYAVDAETSFNKMLFDRTLSTSEGESRTAYSVVTKSATYENLSLVGVTHDETPDAFDLLEYSLSFQELLFSSASGETRTADASNASAQPTQAKGPQTSRPGK